MKPEKEQAPIIQTKSPELEALLEHNLMKGHENAQETHRLLEANLMKSHEHDKKTELQADNQLEIQAKTHDAVKEGTDKVVEALKPVRNTASFIEHFLESVKGDQGEKGDKGDEGEKGEQGNKGDSIKGDKGEQGLPSNVPGPKGDKGEQGIPGRDGIDGKDGRDGKDGKNGKDGKDGSPDDGDTIVKKITGKISYKHIKDAPQFPRLAGTGYLREITDVDTTGLVDGQTLVWNAKTNKWTVGAASGVTPKRYDLSSYLDGTTTSFTIPANVEIVGVFYSSAPFIMTTPSDYSGSGTTTITFTTPPASGQTLLVIYY